MENSYFHYNIILQNEYYCTTSTDSFFPLFLSINYHLLNLIFDNIPNSKVDNSYLPFQKTNKGVKK